MKNLLTLFFILTACSPSIPKGMSPEMKEAEECHVIASKITKIYTDQMHREKDLIAIGTGGGGADKLRMLGVTFVTYKKYDIQEARSLLIYSLEEYIKVINKHPEIEKYSRNFPYTNKNIDITILFYDANNEMLNECQFVSKPFIAAADSAEGKVLFWVYSAENLEVVHKETYEEALAENCKSTSKDE